MAVVAKVETISRDIEAIVRDDLSPAAQSKAFARLARMQRDEAIVHNEAVLGREVTYETAVNGRLGASEDTVTLPGVISYEFEVGTNIVAEVVALLKQHAPVRSGRYQKSISVFADGIEVDEDAVPPAFEEVIILSMVAYARKIERGRSKQAPNGVFQVAAEMMNRKYSRVAQIKFSYGAPLGAVGSHLENWAGRAKQTRKRYAKGGNKAEFARGEWNRRQPAIRIRLK